MSETGQAGKERRYARIGALTDTQRRTLLFFMCGYAPEAVDTALDAFGVGRETEEDNDRAPS